LLVELDGSPNMEPETLPEDDDVTSRPRVSDQGNQSMAFTCDDPNDPLNDLCQDGGTCGGDECYCPGPRCTGKLCEICKG